MPQELMLPSRKQKQLDKCEVRIAKGMIGAFYEVGKALAEINENGLYQQYGTFAGYVDERWGMKSSHAYRLIEATSIMDRLECPQLGTLPTHESHVRHLTKVDPADLPAVWEKVVEEAPKTEDKKPVITEKLVKDVVEWWLAPDDDEPIDTTAEEVEQHDDYEEVEPEEEAHEEESCIMDRFLLVWDEADEVGRAAIRAFILNN